MRRIIDSDQLRKELDWKFFRGLSYGCLGLSLARFFGYLAYIPGLWILTAATWALLLVLTIPLVLTAWLNVSQGRCWYEGFNPERLMALGAIAILLLTGIALEGYRAW